MRRWHRLPHHLVLVGFLLASALVAVGAHEHNVWAGDAPESVLCVIDHESAAGNAGAAETRQGEPGLRAAERGHRHFCVGLHHTAPPPAIYCDPTPRPYDGPAVAVLFVSEATAPRGSDHELPQPRGPPAT